MMNGGAFIRAVLLVALMALALPACQSPPDVVQTDSGPISGKLEQGIREFFGIPFAAPPVGDLRWKPPQPVSPWTSIRACTELPPGCPQPAGSPLIGSVTSQDEDCLYLNVWTPAQTAGEKLPVMVWIHGGAFCLGSGSDPAYDGLNLARRGVVVVTLNYRLGPLGFLAHPLLAKESPAGHTGNYGLLDQMAALQWVQKNIAAFGGDPGCVTIFGQSAGSESVCLLVESPLTTGLFHRAIGESGGPVGQEFLLHTAKGPLDQALDTGQRFATTLGCDTAPDVLAAMRSKTPAEILKAASMSLDLFSGDMGFAPVLDGWVLPLDPVAWWAEGKQQSVPIIIGSNRDEGTALVSETDVSIDQYQTYMRSTFGDDAGKMLDVFPATSQNDVLPALNRFVTVANFAQPARFVAQNAGAAKSKAYLYQFTRLPNTGMARKLGVYHGLEFNYVFGHLNPSLGYNDQDQALSRTMMDYWTNFARTGNPNGPGLVEWPAYDSSTDQNLEFGDTVRTNSGLLKQECDLLLSIEQKGYTWKSWKKAGA